MKKYLSILIAFMLMALVSCQPKQEIYRLTKRVIRVADDGKSAMAIDQIENTPLFGPDLPVRVTSHLIKTENGWKIDYMGWGLIPDNEDLKKITAAIAM